MGGPETATVPMPSILDGQANNPQAYVRAARELLNLMLAGKLKTTDYKRMREGLAEGCEANTGIPLADASRQNVDRVAAFMGLMESSEADLGGLEKTVAAIRDPRIDGALKKKWADLIQRTIRLQHVCREDPLLCWLYVGRDEDPKRAGKVFRMAPIHQEFFNIWTDPDYLHSLIEAPIGHGKSTNMRGLMIWEIGRQPELRCLYITDEATKAQRTVSALKRLMRSARYRALFPDVRVLTRAEDTEDSRKRFTVVRKNWQARDPSFEAAGVFGRVQGNRYDRIYGDDVCPSVVRDHPTERNRVHRKWFSVVMGRIADPATSRIRLICTPWHPDDVAGHIARLAGEGTLTSWRVEIDQFRILDNAQGRAVPVWSKFGTNFLEQCKVTDGPDYDFKYRLKPASTSNVVVRRLIYYDGDPATDSNESHRLQRYILENCERWLSIDPAGTTGRKSSDTGIVEIAISPKGYVFVTNCWFLHVVIKEVIDEIAMLVRRAAPWNYTGLHWEAAGAIRVGLPAVIELLLRQLREGDSSKGIEPYANTDGLQIVTTGARVGGFTQNAGKIMRLKACAGFLESGLIRFSGHQRINHTMPTSHPRRRYCDVRPGTTIADLANHILHFDPTRNTDAVDALIQWVLYNRARIRNPQLGQPYIPPADNTPKTPNRRMALSMDRQIQEIRRLAGEGRSSGEEEQEFYAAMTERDVA